MKNKNAVEHTFFYDVTAKTLASGEVIYTKRWNFRHLILSLVGAVLVIVILATSFTIVPTGYTGVRTTFGIVDEQPVHEGFNWKLPLVQKVVQVNNKQQDITIYDQIWSETSERTAIYYENVVVTYTIRPDSSAWIYSHVNNYRSNLIDASIVASAVKSASKTLNSTDATNRNLIEPLVAEFLQKALDEKYDGQVVYINKVVVSNVDFEQSYNDAIAQKQTAQIAYEQQQIENQRQVEAAKAEAEAKRIAAEADAEAMRIRAEAEADANRKVAETLTEGVLEKMYYDNWDGVLPEVVGESTVIRGLGE